tara:strand:+ start:2521 stop:3423 length:903 start_codon:yes stop_codon:yes gene_type:complete
MASFNYRYPNSQLERDSDFLEVKVVEYKAPGFDMGGQGQTFSMGSSSKALKGNIENPLGYIFLPIPESIQDSNGVSWGEDGINGLAAKGFQATKDAMGSDNLFGGLGGLLKEGAGGIGALAADGSTMNMATTWLASEALNTLGANTSVGGLLARSSGQILNPNTELLFQGIQLRAFNFDFDFAPRDERESETIKGIIRTFKINMSARNSSKDSSTNGLFIKSPNVFQLKYKTGSGDHQFLHQFKPMALSNMAVNYTGSGTYSTYDDATPVHMKLSLSFQELNPVYAEDYEEEQGLTGVGY